jgi:Tfp pilus assembly protein PilO
MAQTESQIPFARYATPFRPFLQSKMVKSYSSLVFSIITATALIVFAVRPTISTIINLQKKLDDLQKISEQLDEKARNIQTAKTKYLQMDETTRQKIKTAVPIAPDVTALVKSLESSLPQQASTSALQIQPLTIYDTNTKDKDVLHPTAGEIDFSYNITGKYDQILQTLANIPTRPRTFNIRNIVISKPQDSDIVLSVTGKGYYLK